MPTIAVFSSAPGARWTGLLSVSLSVLLASCGGGGGSDAPASAASPTAVAVTPAAVTTSTATASAIGGPGAPQATGDTATDGLNWFNYRRQMLGEPLLARTVSIDTAAQGHSRYQQLNDLITHDQIQGKPGFTGATVGDRLTAAGYRFARNSYAYGEVISSTSDQSGFNAAEELIAAIYHRFAIFEPLFRQAGAGSAVSNSGRTYFTVDMTADGLTPALGKGNFLVYPADQQRSLPTKFDSDFESPDPIPNRNTVGYPVSIHADITSTVTVGSFSIAPRGGTALPATILQHGTDIHTPASAAALIALDVLAPGTAYDVQFTGTVDGVAASRNWSFTTR